MNSAKPLKFTIASDFAHGREVQDQILQRVQQCAFDEESAFAIRIALEEAMINAIKHGNKLDPSKQVTIEADIQPGRAEIIVEDQGPGFNPDNVPDPTAEENLCKCSGRGLLLMRAYLSDVKWTKNGRRVHMIRLASNGKTSENNH